MHALCCVVSWYVPAEHCVHTVAPATAYFPLAHGMNPKAPEVGQKPPSWHGSQNVSPSSGPYLPAVHATHEVEPELAAYRPKKHVVQDVARADE